MRQRNRLLGGLVAGFLCLSACAPPPAVPVTTVVVDPTETTLPTMSESDVTPELPTPTPVPLAARVNGEPITLAAYEQQMARYEASMLATGEDPSTPEGEQKLAEARVLVLDWMIEQTLMIQAAVEHGITVDNAEVEAAIEALVFDIGQEVFEQRLVEEGLTVEGMREELRMQMVVSRMAEVAAGTVPTLTEHVNARHIVVGTEEEARQLLTQIQAGADFAALAQAYSQDVFTRDRGGDLGYFPRGILTSAEVEDAAFALQPGQVSDVMQSTLGYHVVQVVDRVPEMEISADNLRLLKDKAVRQWLEELRENAEIERFIEPAT